MGTEVVFPIAWLVSAIAFVLLLILRLPEIRRNALRLLRPTRLQLASFCFSSSLSCCGFAWPFVRFMVWPTKNCSSLSLPPR